MDGNVDALVEAVYDEVLVRTAYQAGLNDVASEVSFLLSQMTAEDKERYLFICLGMLVDQFHREIHRDIGPETDG
jgi:hypothetical protein